MKKVLIVGAGGFGRELLGWCMHDATYGTDWHVTGFLDDNEEALADYDMPVGVVGRVGDYRPGAGEELLCAIGKPAVKQRVVESLLAVGGVFRGYVHPSVVQGRHVRLGRGVVLCPGVVLTSNLELGDFVMVNCLSSAGHDVRVGSYTTISGHCDLAGFVQIGAGVFMGSRASIIPGKKVGAGAVIGAGAVVIMDVTAGVTVFGNPARRLS